MRNDVGLVAFAHIRRGLRRDRSNRGRDGLMNTDDLFQTGVAMMRAQAEELRPAERCLVTGQPIYCPKCGSLLDKRGQCTDPRERCDLYADWSDVVPYPTYEEMRR
jgi:hypothetical protein